MGDTFFGFSLLADSQDGDMLFSFVFLVSALQLPKVSSLRQIPARPEGSSWEILLGNGRLTEVETCFAFTFAFGCWTVDTAKKANDSSNSQP
jgi:hypothetical protein